MKKYTLLLTLALILASCSTPYQEEGFFGGYRDSMLGGNQYAVTFTGNGYTSRDTTTEYAYKRAGELCASKGFQSYKVVQELQEGLSMSPITTVNVLCRP